MCGIVGFSGIKNQDLLVQMAEQISYRGPDERGYFSNDKINFGHLRLSIIDLAGGKQPMSSADNQITLIFNGEIYNHNELRKKYLSAYPFKTKSDTETIIYLYQQFGLDFPKYLNGMFALAIWDNRKQRLILVRDRLGKKPLYYRTHQNEIYFASEPKSLSLNYFGAKKINYQGLGYYLRFQFYPSDQSALEGIKKLLPGHLAVWEGNQFKIEKYWSLDFSSTEDSDKNKFGELLEDAIKTRLVSDVPLGVFLSGGLDSSTVAYFAAKNSISKVKTFSIGFEDKSFDESRYSKQVSEFLKTDHYHCLFSEKEILDLMPLIFSLQDEPMADASIFPTYLLCAFVRKQVTVALSGDGSDELLAGYPTFQAHKLADIYSASPNFLRQNFSQIIKNLPVSFNNFSFDFKLKRFIRSADKTGYWRDLDWTSAFDLAEQANLIKEDYHIELGLNNQDKNLADFFDLNQSDLNKQVLNFWQKGYLVDDILIKADRASMYNSLEGRSPFLDYRIVEYLNHCPDKAKINGWQTKYLLKDLMKDKLPKNIVYRKKKGFGVPISKWLTGPLKSFMLDTLSHESLSQIEIFNLAYVDKLIDDHLNQKQDNRLKLWTLINFVQWYNNWFIKNR